MLISSTSNPRLNMARALKSAQERYVQGLFLAEGVRILEEVIQANLKVKQLFYIPEDIKSGRERKLLEELLKVTEEEYTVNERCLKVLAETEQPQGLIATVEIPDHPLPWSEKSQIIIADRLQDPGNMGSLIRLSAAFACQAICLLPGCVDPWNAKVLRGAMGASFRLPILRLSEDNLITKLKQYSIPLMVAMPIAEMNVWDVNWRNGWALAIGNEGAGVSEKLLGQDGLQFTIPMPGATESLNAAHAAAIALYEASKQRFF